MIKQKQLLPRVHPNKWQNFIWKLENNLNTGKYLSLCFDIDCAINFYMRLGETADPHCQISVGRGKKIPFMQFRIDW